MRLSIFSRPRVRVAAAVGVGLAIASCTLLGSRDVEQCAIDADCASSPLAAPVVCSSGICVSRSATLADAGGDAPDAAQQCTASEQCTDQSATCLEGRCVPLTDNALCPFVLPPGPSFRRSDVTVIGLYASSGAGINEEPAVAAARLALDEINKGDPRLVALVCRKEANRAPDVLRYLSARKIPLVVGQFSSADLETLALPARDQGIAIWSTFGNADIVQKIDAREHVSFLLDELSRTQPAFQAGFDRQIIRTNDAGTSATDVRVALLVAAGEPETTDLENALKQPGGLVVNGTSISELDSAHLYRSQVPTDAPSLKKIASDVQPHIVIGLGGDAVLDAIESIENNSNWLGQARPAYLLSSRSKYRPTSLATLSRNNITFRRRLLGVDFSGDAAKQANYVSGLNAARYVSDAFPFDVIYDAMYVAALATEAPRAADAGGPLRAADFIQALKQFRSADVSTAQATVDVGPGAAYANGRQAISTNKTIHFRGVTGSWQFDPTLPTRRMQTSFYCFKTGGGHELLYYRDPSFALCEP